jgi:hypothetical protein
MNYENNEDNFNDVMDLIQNAYGEVPISFQSYDKAVSEELTKNLPFRNIMMSLQRTNIELADNIQSMMNGKNFNYTIFDTHREKIAYGIERLLIDSLDTLVDRSIVNYVFDTLNYLNTVKNRRYNLFDILLSNTRDSRFVEVYNVNRDINFNLTDIIYKNSCNNDDTSPYLFSSLQLDVYDDQFDTAVNIGDMYQSIISQSMFNTVINIMSNLIQISLQNNFTEIRELVYGEYKSNYKNTPNEFMDIQNYIYYKLSQPIRELNYNIDLFAGYLMEMIKGSMYYGFSDFIALNEKDK